MEALIKSCWGHKQYKKRAAQERSFYLAHSMNIWDSSSYDVGESIVKGNSTPTDFPI